MKSTVTGKGLTDFTSSQQYKTIKLLAYTSVATQYITSALK